MTIVKLPVVGFAIPPIVAFPWSFSVYSIDNSKVPDEPYSIYSSIYSSCSFPGCGLCLGRVKGLFLFICLMIYMFWGIFWLYIVAWFFLFVICEERELLGGILVELWEWYECQPCPGGKLCQRGWFLCSWPPEDKLQLVSLGQSTATILARGFWEAKTCKEREIAFNDWEEDNCLHGSEKPRQGNLLFC